MPLVKMEQGNWFSEEQTIYDGDVFKSPIDDVFTLTACSTNSQSTSPLVIGSILYDVDKLLFRTTDADEYSNAVDNYLRLHFDTNRSIPYERPYSIKFDLKINADDFNKEGIFSCDFLKSNYNGIDYTLKILDLKKDGSHRIYLENDSKVISYPLSFNWFTLELTFYPDNQNISSCNVSLDGYNLGIIDFPDPQYNDVDIYLCSVNGNVDIANFTITRMIEQINPNKIKLKIEQTLKENTVVLSAGKQIIYADDAYYYKIVITKNSNMSYNSSVIANGKFKNLTYKGRRTTNYVANIMSVDFYFEDPLGNEIECTGTYLSSRWSDNGHRDYAPSNFFATTNAESWVDTYSPNYSELISGGSSQLIFEILFKTKIPFEYINNFTFNNGRGSNSITNIKVYRSDDLTEFTEIIDTNLDYVDNAYTFSV